MRKYMLLITGEPGIGKTTVMTRVVDTLKTKGLKVGGMITHETREEGARTGFRITDLSDGTTGCLASIGQKTGPRIGKYNVNLHDLNSIGVKAILRAIENADMIVIDEIGPMELLSEQFRRIIRKVAEAKKPAMCTLHHKMKHRLDEIVTNPQETEIYETTRENRENLHKVITHAALNLLSHEKTKKRLLPRPNDNF